MPNQIKEEKKNDLLVYLMYLVFKDGQGQVNWSNSGSGLPSN